ncbi:MAG: hypothetical protein A7316_10290 [Candidatus Altiarchaeales archaeon WOR_SM1_86-2]|nr:MAG: hypothetical protein A7316_10290 [Candidatus Altiarchaeales archaeon WOR_SM1_86-2]
MPTAKTEDYLEAMLELEQEKGYIRVKDIADKHGVSSPTVIEMLEKLDARGFIRYEKYGGISLMEKGKRIASEIKHMHELLTEFLRIIGIPQKTAQRDACKIEHHLSPETVEQLTRFVEFMKKNQSAEWLKDIKD